MANPVVVQAYTTTASSPARASRGSPTDIHTLPPVSSFAFASILRSADCTDFQDAINGIAEICAKNHMSLADEYASHLPPLGEITAASASSAAMKPHLVRPGTTRVLASVPEASSSSGSERSGIKRKTRRMFSFGRTTQVPSNDMRRIQIGRMGRTIIVRSTVALAGTGGFGHGSPHDTSSTSPTGQQGPGGPTLGATKSLQRLLLPSSSPTE